MQVYYTHNMLLAGRVAASILHPITVDEAAYYTSALSSAHIAAHYNAGT